MEQPFLPPSAIAFGPILVLLLTDLGYSNWGGLNTPKKELHMALPDY